MPEVGIIISATDKASSVLSNVSENAKKGFEFAGKAVVVFNQALELGKKAIETFRFLILDNLTAMIEYRGENDKISRQLREMADNAKFLQATIANVLTPIVLGLGDAFKDVGDDVIEFIQTNKGVIATGIASYLAEIARIAITGVAAAINIVSKAYSGWIEIIYLVKAATEKQFQVLLDGIAFVIKGHAELASFISDDLAESLNSAAGSVSALGDEFGRSAGESMQAVENQIAKQKEFEETLNRFKNIAVDFVGKAELAILDRIAKGWSNVKKHTDEVTDATENQRATFESLRPTAAAYYTNLANLQEQTARHEEARLMQTAQMNSLVASGVIGAWGNAMANIITDSENAGKHMIMMILDSAQVAIQAYAAQAAAGAAASQSAIPFIGPILAAAAASAVFGMVKAFIGQLPSFAQGGRLAGGIPGRDSALFVGQQGERILSVAQNRNFERLVGALDKMTQTGMTPAVVGGSFQQVNNFPSVVPQTSAEMSRSFRNVNQQVKRAKKRGFKT